MSNSSKSARRKGARRLRRSTSTRTTKDTLHVFFKGRVSYFACFFLSVRGNGKVQEENGGHQNQGWSHEDVKRGLEAKESKRSIVEGFRVTE